MENVTQQIGNGDDACASRSLRLSDHVFPFGDISVFIEGRLYRLGADNGKGLILLVKVLPFEGKNFADPQAREHGGQAKRFEQCARADRL